MSLDDAMSTVLNAQHADLAISNPEKAKRNWSKKWSMRSSRESKKMDKLMTSMIKAFEENAKYKTELALLKQNAEIMKFEKNQLTREINELMSHTQQIDHLVRMWKQQMEHEIRMKDSLIKNLISLVNHLKKTTGEVVVQAGMKPQYYGGSSTSATAPTEPSTTAVSTPAPAAAYQDATTSSSSTYQDAAAAAAATQTVPAQMMMQLQSQMQVMMRPQGLGQIPPSWQNVASGSPEMKPPQGKEEEIMRQGKDHKQ